MAIFKNVHVSFQKLPPSTRGQKEGDATVPFRPERARGVGEVNEVVWWSFIEVW
jgi:hypothetical protein